MANQSARCIEVDGEKVALFKSEDAFCALSAVAFFGPGGLGLRIANQAPDRASFDGGGGFVIGGAQARDPSGDTEVVADAREWEADARRFLGRV